ncbi:response regulator [Trichlorobacter lovleyi]|uniref:response regulator n=1 Tax=Trichlorobacter lovleyi TaxID=313985 RepID=UPI002480DDCD|nr:HD domain-containing phosphohydrolase [Trichlorobacter lovleyi]
MEVVADSVDRIETTVLLVDDEPNILQALQRLLRRETFRIVTAASGTEALQLLSQLRGVAVILSDMRMPAMNGAEFLKRSREFAPESVRMLLTGYSDISDAVDAVNQGGISRYLSKPWNDTDLLQAVRIAVESYSLSYENKRLQELVSRQNKELQDWNQNLKERVLQQTAAIRQKNEELHNFIKQQKEAFQSLISSFGSLVEMRGARSRQHAANVAKLSVLVAGEMGLAKDDQEIIRTAAMLHDIGEIGLSERITLVSPESLSQDDFVEYSQHPIRAQLLIDPIEELRPAGVLIRHHHEMFNGNGFPDHLAGDEIPLGARIIAYADLMDRAARQCSGNVAEQALQWTDIHVGKALDPALRTLFRKFTKYVYLPPPRFSGGLESGERDVKLDDLEPGMTLARSIYSGSGILLLHVGVTLGAKHIGALRRYFELDPTDEPICILRTGRTTAGVMV